jgi:hypothetical protein
MLAASSTVAVDSRWLSKGVRRHSEITSMPIPGRRVVARLSPRTRQSLKVAVIVALIVVASAGGALYYLRYGDKTRTDYQSILNSTQELLKVDVPPRLWPRLVIERPDVMTMVIYATKDNEVCLAVLRCRPNWTRERGNRPDRLLQSVLLEYCPEFETERWTSSEDREVTIRGTTQHVHDAIARRPDNKKEYRVLSLDDLPTEQGSVSLYFQTPNDSSTDDEVDALLKSLK